MRPPAALVAVAASLFAATAFAQQPPAPPTAPAPWTYAPPPYAPYYGPWAPPPEPRVTERRSKGMMITGIVFWGLGGIASGVGGAMLGIAMTHPCVQFAVADVPAQAAALGERIGTGRQALSRCEAPGVIGLGMLAAGVLTGALGIPFFVVGNSRVPVKPELHVGPTGAALRWTF